MASGGCFYIALNITQNKKNDAMKRNLYRMLVVGRRFAHKHENRVVFGLSMLTLFGLIDLFLLIAGEFLTI